MSLGDSIKEIYFKGEEKWYNFLDKLDQSIPVYKIIDRVDEIVPSFALLIVLIMILILLVGISFVMPGQQQAILKLSVVDNDGELIGGAKVTIDGITDEYYSNNFGLIKDIEVPLGRTISVTAEKDGKEKTEPIKISFSETIAEIKLPFDSISFSSKTIQILSQEGTLITDPLTLNYSCTNGVGPEPETIYNGIANASVPTDCGALSLTINSENYETKTQQITNASTSIVLTEKEIKQKGEVYITLEDVEGELIDEIEVSAYLADTQYYPEKTVESENGIAKFELTEGDYVFKTRQMNGYKQAISQRITINNIPKRETLELEKSILGKINVKVKKGSINFEDVLVTIRKTTELDRATTDYNGIVEFELAEDGEFIITASKEGYCSESTIAELGDEVELKMKTDNGTCGGELKVKVIDQDEKPVTYARTILFGQKDEDEYKLSYTDKITDYNGKASWNPVTYASEGETYKIFAYKGDYSGWSEPINFTALNSKQEIEVKLELPTGIVGLNIKDKYGEAIRFAEVQLFETIANEEVTGTQLTNEEGKIQFEIKAGQRIYAVIQKEEYESYMTMPKDVKGNSTINYEVVLEKPPAEEIKVNSLGLFKDDTKVLRAEPGQDYIAKFEIIAPKRYSELGFFARAGKENISKTEFDKIYIKEIISPGEKIYDAYDIDEETLYGSTFNPPKGYNIDTDYLNLEESKWGQVVWTENGYEIGKIIVGVKIRIKENANLNEQLELGYRIWGLEDGYERDPIDNSLGTSQNSSTKNALYALTKTQYVWIGTESLCENQGENSFCVSTTITDDDLLTTSFESSIDLENGSNYDLAIKVYNNSEKNFENSQFSLENEMSNLLLKEYSLVKPNGTTNLGTINGYETEWIQTNDYKKSTEIQIQSLGINTQKTGYAPLLLKIRDTSKIIFEKIFNINIMSDKKLSVEFLYDSKYQETIPEIISGQKQNLTLKIKNTANNLEINEAKIKLYDRFGTKLYEKKTNKIGIGTIEIPASMPGEKLKIQVEKKGYETQEIDFSISENVITVNPETLSFSVNPQSKTEEIKSVKIENKTGFDLTIQEIRFNGKTKGLISEKQMEGWFELYKGKTIKMNDYEEIDFKIISAKIIPSAGDIEGKFQIIVGNGIKNWLKEIDTKIRVGLGNDVDIVDCLEITQTNWQASTKGNEIQLSLEINNNCRVEGNPVILRNLGAKLEPSTNTAGSFSATTTGAYTALSRGFSRIFKTKIEGEETTPVILRFTPYGGTTGTTEGTIIFETINKTDSSDQIITTSLDYSINIIDSSCLVIGSELVNVPLEGTATFNITNNCPEQASFQIDSSLSIDNKIFTLNANESKDVTIISNEGDIPGAYNNLVFGRIGNEKQELIGNVKAIIEDTESCFKLSRYEYDVYDSPYNETDGFDTGYLKNTCTQKNVSVSVSGQKDFDWDLVLRDMLIGAVTGFFTSDQNDWLKKIFGDTLGGKIRSLSEKNNTAKNELIKRLKLKFAKGATAITEKLDNAEKYVTKVQKLKTIYDVNPPGKKFNKKLNEFKQNVKNRFDELKKEYKEIIKDFDNNVDELQTRVNVLYEEAEKQIKNNETDNDDLYEKYKTKAQEIQNAYNAKVDEVNKKIKEIDEEFVEKFKIKCKNTIEEFEHKGPQFHIVPRNFCTLGDVSGEKILTDERVSERLKDTTPDNVLPTQLADLIKDYLKSEQAQESSRESSNGSPTAIFLLASSNKGFNGLGSLLGNNMINIGVGAMGGSALGGGLLAGLTSIMQGQDLEINYLDGFNVPLVEFTGASLQSEGGVSMSVGDVKYDYEESYLTNGANQTVQQSQNNTTNNQNPQANQQSQGIYAKGQPIGQGYNNNNGYTYNPSSMQATVGLQEVRELVFSGGETSDTPYKPFEGILTITGEEKVYETEYDYEEIRKKADKRGDLKTNKGNWLQEFLNPTQEPIAQMEEEDLKVLETRGIEKKYHLLFNNFQYVECGPNTYPCQSKQINNCQVGNKTGMTGEEAVPKILLDWRWNNVNTEQCNEENPNYTYCDITQYTISNLKKILYMKNFFNSNNLSECPSTLDITGTKTQELSTSTIDVAITSIKLEEEGDNVTIETMIETNNNLELLAGLNYELTRNDGTSVNADCNEDKQAITSYKAYKCTLNKNNIGTGEFNLTVSLDIELCDGCENNDSSNDVIKTKMILGSNGIQNCETYDTESKNYFEKVLSANNILNNQDSQKMLNYIIGTVNLTKDGFSEDFRSDFDNYLMQFASAPQEYEENLREIFMNKLEFRGPGGRSYWEAGKYKASIEIYFKEESWQWTDTNDIEKIVIDIEPWAEPDIDHAIYDVSFNGTIGINSDNGRNGYGVSYNQQSEKAVTIVESSGAGQTIRTTSDPSSNPLTTVNVNYDESFYNMNSLNSGTRGNVLTISRTGETIGFNLSPSIAVPMVLDVTRTNALDAYAYYSVEINGQTQDVGPSLVTWTGIGQGCVDFTGAGMNSWNESFDSLNENGDGYGLRWNNVIAKGTASFYGVMYVPEQSSSALIINSASESASFETPFGNGTTIIIDSQDGIRSIKEVFDAVKNGEVCVAGGHYFWNNKKIIEQLQSSINEKENSCMTIS